MAERQAVWGIDIGQAGLKAVRLRYAEAASQVIAVAFDYIPHAKILSQPDAVPEDLINSALATFLSRNETKGDLIAISVPGQSALTRFIQLPPVESSKVDEIVRYEAKQQIPFALEDVIWDYQTLGGGVEESGYMLGAEVGLFAMKKEGIHGALKPFLAQKIEIELIQLAPLALYNFLCYDQIGLRPGQILEGETDFMIVLDMGTDNTTLLVTNGNKIWIRNVPIGGNHFTRALTKEMKLTFAKAEHLKCNATKAPDPRAVFQALRPVFNDYVAEIQRSIGYFSSVNREAKITKVVGAGNGFKLAGLQKFLQQNLQYEVERVETFQAAVGDAVLNAPLFQENVLSFSVAYGLALQALQQTRIHTTLLPKEIALARMIRRKKPWAVTAAASLLAGLAMSTAGYSNVANSVSEGRFSDAEKNVTTLISLKKGHEDNFDKAKRKNAELKDAGDKLVTNLDVRELWLEVYRAINECLPRDVADEQDVEDVTLKNRVNVKSVSTKKYADVGKWYDDVKSNNEPAFRGMLQGDKDKRPTGVGYVFTLVCEHFRHDPQDAQQQSIAFVNNTVVKNLNSFEMRQQGTSQPTPVRKLGISHACVVTQKLSQRQEYYPKGPKARRGAPKPAARGFAGNPMPTRPPSQPAASDSQKKDGEVPEMKVILRTDFTIQFVWSPTPAAKRVNDDPLKPPGTNVTANPSNPNAATATVTAQPENATAANAPVTQPSTTPVPTALPMPMK